MLQNSYGIVLVVDWDIIMIYFISMICAMFRLSVLKKNHRIFLKYLKRIAQFNDKQGWWSYILPSMLCDLWELRPSPIHIYLVLL